MTKLQVHLHSVQDVRRFVDIATKYNFPIFAQAKDGDVDAKSLIGLFTVNLRKPVEIVFDAPEADALRFRDEIGTFCAAE